MLCLRWNPETFIIAVIGLESGKYYGFKVANSYLLFKKQKVDFENRLFLQLGGKNQSLKDPFPIYNCKIKQEKSSIMKIYPVTSN